MKIGRIRRTLARTAAKTARWLAGLDAVRRPRSSRQQISQAFGVTPAQLGGYLQNALDDSDAGWEAFCALIAIFERYVLTDAHLKSVYLSVRMDLAQLPHTIVAAADDPQGEEIAAWLEAALAQIPRFRRTVLYELTDGVGVGFAATELFGALAADGTERVTSAQGLPQWLLRDDPNRPGEYQIRTETGWADVPVGKLLVWRNEEKGSVVTGGLMWQCLWLALFKNFSFKDWVGFLETYGQPLRIGYYEPSASDEDQAILATAVIDIASDAGVILPKGMEIDFKEAMGGDSAAFERLISRIDFYFALLLTGGQLNVEAGDKGARSLGEVHERRALARVKFYAGDLAETISQQLLRQLVIRNFGERPDYPRFQFVMRSIIELAAQWEVDQGALAAGVPIPVRYFRDTYGWPEPIDDEPIVVVPAASPSFPFAPGGNARTALARRPASTGESDFAMLDAFADRGAPAAEPAAAAFIAALGDAAEAVNWAALRNDLERAGDDPDERRAWRDRAAAALAKKLPEAARRQFAAGFAAQLAPLLTPALAAGVGMIAADADAAGVTVDFEEMFDEVISELGGAATALTRLPRTRRFPLANRAALARLQGIDADLDWDAVQPVEATAWWAKKVGVKSSAFKGLDAASRAYAFSIAGVEQETIINAAADGIRRGLAEGISAGQFSRVVRSAAEAAGLAGPSPSHLRFVFQQNLMTAYGAGRAASQHSAAVKRYLPYIQLRTVGDGNVRLEHQGLNGLTMRADDRRWRYLTPPLDFGCRCRTISVREPGPGALTDPGAYAPPVGFNAGGPLGQWISALQEAA